MHRNYFIAIILFSFSASAQVAKFDPLNLNLQEIRDSGYRKLYILRYWYNYENAPEYTDTMHIFQFDTAGRIIYKNFPNYSGDSLVSKFNYQSFGLASKEEISYFQGKISRGYQLNYKPDGKLNFQVRFSKYNKLGDTTYFSYNNKGKLISEITRGTYPSHEIYTYDLSDKLIQVKYSTNDSSYTQLLYSYNEKDSLIKIIQVEKYGKRIDSVRYAYEHDQRGNKTVTIREPSKTFYKTFAYGCSTGDFVYDVRQYDSLGRIIYEADREEELRGDSIRYRAKAYATYAYSEEGYVKQFFDKNNSPDGKSVYSRYESHRPVHILRESFDASSTITVFLSSKSNLPKRINELGNEQGFICTTVFVYSK